MFHRLSASLYRTLPMLARQTEVASVGVNSCRISGLLQKSISSTPSPKPIRASFVPWMSFFRQHQVQNFPFPQTHHFDQRIAGVLAVVSLLALSKKTDCEQRQGNGQVDDLSNLVFESFPALDKLKSTEPVLFIGAAGSGKGETLNHLMGISMKIAKVDSLGHVTLESDDPSAFRMDEADDTPQSAVVKTRQEPISGLWLTDAPSFSEGRRKTYQYASEISCSLATQAAEKTKALVVTITVKALNEDKGKRFREIALILHNLVVNAAETKQSIFFCLQKAR